MGVPTRARSGDVAAVPTAFHNLMWKSVRRQFWFKMRCLSQIRHHIAELYHGMTGQVVIGKCERLRLGVGPLYSNFLRNRVLCSVVTNGRVENGSSLNSRSSVVQILPFMESY